MKRRLHFPFLVALLLALCLLGVGTHFLHAYQVKRNASSLLTLADEAEQAGELARSVDYLSRYLGLPPADAAVPARHALVTEKLARSPGARARAFLALERVLQRNPERADVRRRAAAVAMELRRFHDANDHLTALEK